MSPLPSRPACLIATDLDGTLLDDDYPLAEAARVIDSVSRAQDAVVALVSSKTLAELLEIADLCTTDPLLVFENGAGIAWPSGCLPRSGASQLAGHEIESDGQPYPALCATLARLKKQLALEFRGFADMSAAEVASLTGLTPRAAAHARDRAYTEPLLWQDDAAALERLRRALAELELKIVAGGRFLHVMPRTTKADAVVRLHGWLRSDGTLPLLCCGDAPNDLELLEVADIAIVFPDRQGHYLLAPSERVIHAAGPGPSRWLDCVREALGRQSQKVEAL